MAGELFWIEGPWRGKLAVAARPRGGDWLEDEVSFWRSARIDEVLSLLTADEEVELDLRGEAEKVGAKGMKFASLPIIDRQAPSSETRVGRMIEQLDADLSAGKNVVIHCRQGIGRSGLIAACLLIAKGLRPGDAIERVSVARGVSIPETTEQRNWIDHYAEVLAGAK